MSDYSVAVDVAVPSPMPQPLRIGCPWAPGERRPGRPLRLMGPGNAPVPGQCRALSSWPDGSLRWELFEAVLPANLAAGSHEYFLRPDDAAPEVSAVVIDEQRDDIVANTGIITLSLSGNEFAPSIRFGHETVKVAVRMRDSSDQNISIDAVRHRVEVAGAVSTTLVSTGRCTRWPHLYLILRTTVFAGSGLIQLRLTIWNRNRAKHPGGIWDLGDPGSCIFEQLELVCELPASIRQRMELSCPLSDFHYAGPPESGEVRQTSSGGPNWNSRAHLDRNQQIAAESPGGHYLQGAREESAQQTKPRLKFAGSAGSLLCAVPRFWEEFPKSVRWNDEEVAIGLFPAWSFGHELQGGEQKSHEVWLALDADPERAVTALDWVHEPPLARFPLERYAVSQAVPWLPPESLAAPSSDRYEAYLADVLTGSNSLFAKRDRVDAYGWRHFGETYADHENEYSDPSVFRISHYNNQYDVVFGLLLQWLRSGDRRWWHLGEDLARHVAEIDIYHTQRDKAAYNGGLFWHTDHYCDAGTCSHRSYSKQNQQPGQPYGGGPSCEHNYSSGLTLYHYLTGDSLARDAVLTLADWAWGLDDPAASIYGLLGDGSTGGGRTTTGAGFAGPGRGPGNSVNTLLDAYDLSGKESYLTKAEEIIGYVVHPAADVDAWNLGDAEGHWSYAVMLHVLARYANRKLVLDERDEMFHYVRESLIRIGEWMVEHERFYLDHPEELEYPFETWACNDLRKANALRLIARLLPPDDERFAAWRDWGTRLADRSWEKLLEFPSAHVTRAVAIVLTEGWKDAWLSTADRLPAGPLSRGNHPPPRDPTPIKARFKAKLRSPLGWMDLALHLPRRAWRHWQWRQSVTQRELQPQPRWQAEPPAAGLATGVGQTSSMPGRPEPANQNG